jgi:hypothetical protein
VLGRIGAFFTEVGVDGGDDCVGGVYGRVESGRVTLWRDGVVLLVGRRPLLFLGGGGIILG